MDDHTLDEAAQMLWRHQVAGTRLAVLPPDARPETRGDGYAIQRRLSSLHRQPVVGWKIAATSVAGQRHIGVDGPLAGSLLAHRIVESGATISLEHNTMRVAEAEFAFRFDRPLPPRERPYERDEVLVAVGSLQPTIEIPDSRYDDFLVAGTAQLIADNACAWWLVVGSDAPDGWRELDLATHRVTAELNGQRAAEGVGANVLDDPRAALTWLVNELRVFGEGVRAGDLVTTGTCIAPVAITPGDRFSADFGVLGHLDVAF